jgi:hypothetical protein
MRRKAGLTWRRRYLVVGFLAVMGTLTFFVAGAFADAGNPIVGTIKGNLVSTPMPGYPDAVTVYVRGQWNWLTHNSDCNADRAGAGAAFIWNDPNEPGYTITKGSISAGVGVKSKLNGDTLNNIDGTAHPADLGNVPESKSGPAGQSFADSTSGSDQPAGAAHPYTTWKGGCGRLPLTDTAGGPNLGTFPTNEATGLTCAGGGSCSGHPWGSWGYRKGSTTNASTTGYSHIYVNRSDVTTVCVDFYDVHGKNQIVGGSKEIDVLGNGDNSIETNAFNPLQGANCIDFPTIKSTTPVSNVTVGAKISDSATVQGASATHQTTLTFHLFRPGDSTCSQASIYDSAPQAVTGNGTAGSGDYDTTPQAAPNDVKTGAGTYQWTVELRDGTTGTGALLDTSGCGKEPSVVNKAPTRTDTTEKVKITEHVKVTATATGTAGIAATGPTRIRLFAGTCSTGHEDNGTTPLYDQTVFLGSGNTVDVDIDIANPGDFYWFVEYKGDSNTDPSNDDCTETFSVHFPVI